MYEFFNFFAELIVILTSTPSGSAYQAASWILFKCSATSGSGLYKYKWKIYCASTNVLISESALGIDTTFRIKSTPTLCSDRIECIAEDTVFPLTGSKSVIVSSVTGNF